MFQLISWDNCVAIWILIVKVLKIHFLKIDTQNAKNSIAFFAIESLHSIVKKIFLVESFVTIAAFLIQDIS